MENDIFSKKTWIALWALPVLFFLLVTTANRKGYVSQSGAAHKSQPLPAPQRPLFAEVPDTAKGNLRFYRVSGAGITKANGLYIETSTDPNSPHYTLISNTNIEIRYIEPVWQIWDASQLATLYLAEGNPHQPPTSPWRSGVIGDLPTPTVALATPSYVVSGAGNAKWNGKYYDAGRDNSGTNQHYYTPDGEHFLTYDKVDGWFLSKNISENLGAFSGTYQAFPFRTYQQGPAGHWEIWEHSESTTPATPFVTTYNNPLQ